ncbi:MAG TPA: flagellar hook capping FlgD N-terminal domain-containing protein [Tepidisphaeraceae bacterium]|jgi:flagellar basal-body rod modification protein FlgD
MTITPSSVKNNEASGTQTAGKMALKAQDFIKMMITQLQNQDPMEPAKNEALLAQMSQISQLQTSTELQGSLKTLVQQNNVSSAGSMIGKMVKGKDASGEELTGLVSSVRVEDGNLFLELDNGKHMALDSVTDITHAAPAATPKPAAATAAS